MAAKFFTDKAGSSPGQQQAQFNGSLSGDVEPVLFHLNEAHEVLWICYTSIDTLKVIGSGRPLCSVQLLQMVAQLPVDHCCSF